MIGKPAHQVAGAVTGTAPHLEYASAIEQVVNDPGPHDPVDILQRIVVCCPIPQLRKPRITAREDLIH